MDGNRGRLKEASIVDGLAGLVREFPCASADTLVHLDVERKLSAERLCGKVNLICRTAGRD